MSDRYGRKRLLIISAILFLISALAVVVFLRMLIIDRKIGCLIIIYNINTFF